MADTDQKNSTKYPMVDHKGRLGYGIPVLPGQWLFVEMAGADDPASVPEAVENPETDLKFIEGWIVIEWVRAMQDEASTPATGNPEPRS